MELSLFAFEWLVLGYAAASAAFTLLAAPRVNRLSAVLVALTLLLAVCLVAAFASLQLRLVAPHLYLLAGYWLPGLMVRGRPMDAFSRSFEAWLLRTDAVLRPWLPRLPSGVTWVLELAYLFCYPLVPLALVLVWFRGTVDDMGRLWLLVLSAGYACYATLPWLLSRPPRVVGAAAEEPGGPRALNALVLGRFSHQWNTFPSGHVAVSVGAAISVWHVWPGAGLLVGALALAVALGAAAGRYHYVIDVGAGLVVALLLAVITW